MVTSVLLLCCGSVTDDDSRLTAGKAKYEAIKKDAKMPKYGPCWTEALIKLDVGCKELTDDVQHHLALGFTNCFLRKTGRGNYPCEDYQDISECTTDMSAEAYNTYSDFFTHTQNICFFLQSQIWQEQTEGTISRLRDSSDSVARQMEDSSHIQSELIKQQNLSIENQQRLLEHGSKLKDTIQASKLDVNKMLLEFKSSTSEQKQLIFEVFDRVNVLQALVMGEFTGFYSLIFYAVSILICYLLTSTPRTSGARFWLFVLMTVNMAMERTLVMWGADQNIDNMGNITDENTVIYHRLSVSRKIFTVFAVFIWGWFAYTYRDMNAVNNKLLMEIQKQNSELKHLLQGHGKITATPVIQSVTYRRADKNMTGHSSEIHGTLSRRISNGAPLRPSVSNTQVAQVSSVLDTTDALLPSLHESSYDVSNAGDFSNDSDFESDSSLDSAATDRTFTADTFNDSDSHCSSASFLTSSSRHRESTPSLWEDIKDELHDELRSLRDCTPLREMTPIPGVTIADTAYNDSSLNTSVSSSLASVTPRRGLGRPRGSARRAMQSPSPTTNRYNLRSRKGQLPSIDNPVVETESPGSFAKTVKHLEQVAIRNRAKAMETVRRSLGQSSQGQSSTGQRSIGRRSAPVQSTTNSMGFFSSDDDV